MAGQKIVPNFQLSDSEDDYSEDITKTKKTGNVLRVYDPERKNFQRLRIRKKRNVRTVATKKTLSKDGLPQKGSQQESKKTKPVVVSPMDPEEERKLRLKIQNDLSQKYSFIDKLQAEEMENGYDSLEKARRAVSQEELSRNRLSLSSVTEPSEIEMTPTNRFGKKSFEGKLSKRKLSHAESQEEKGSAKCKRPRFSNNVEDDVLTETSGNHERKMKFKRKEKFDKKMGSETNSKGMKSEPSGGGAHEGSELQSFTPKFKHTKNVKTPTANFKNMKTPTPKFNKNKSPAYMSKGDGSMKNQKWKSEKRQDKAGPNAKNRNIQGKQYVSIVDQTPEFFRVKDEDSVKLEKKERRRQRQITMCKKTKRGQPVMRGRIELMLEKIKKDLSKKSEF